MLFIIFTFGLIWGSFLNVVAYRLITQETIGGRSKCPHCNCQIAWYDNIPLISWIILGGKCRSCAQPISILYPFIELLTGILFVLLYLKMMPHCPAYDSSTVRSEWVNQLCEAWATSSAVRPDISHAQYARPLSSVPALSWRGAKGLIPHFIFFSALIITIRTDLEFMLISRFTTTFLIPVGIALSALEFLPISPLESFLSALGGYLLFYAIARGFYLITGKEGMGDGDMDLIAFIGSFTGLMGLWMTILIGSVTGCIATIIYLLSTGQHRSTRIPFGPFLALGAISYVLFGAWLMKLIG